MAEEQDCYQRKVYPLWRVVPAQPALNSACGRIIYVSELATRQTDRYAEAFRVVSLIRGRAVQL